MNIKAMVLGGFAGLMLAGAASAQTVIITTDQRPRFREYVTREHRPSFTYREDVRVGAVLPDEGVTYYDVPPEYGATGYRYTVVNNRPVMVEPRTRRIVEIYE